MEDGKRKEGKEPGPELKPLNRAETVLKLADAKTQALRGAMAEADAMMAKFKANEGRPVWWMGRYWSASSNWSDILNAVPIDKTEIEAIETQIALGLMTGWTV